MDADEDVVRRLVELSGNANDPELLDRFVDSRCASTLGPRAPRRPPRASISSATRSGASTRNSQIVEWWRNDDFVRLLQQLGRDPLST